MSADAKSPQRAKGAAQNHKQTLQKIHRVIDGYIQGRGATSCMDEVKTLLGRNEGKAQ